MSFQDDPRDLNGPDETFDSTPTTEQGDESAGYEAYGEAYDAARVLRLHEHIERLRAERRPERVEGASTEDASLHGVAALLHAAAPDTADPNPMFAAALLARLEREAASVSESVSAPVQAEPSLLPTPIPLPVAPQSEAGATASPQRVIRTGRTHTRSGVSRRGLLAGGLGAAAAAVVGAAAGALYEQQAAITQGATHTTAIVPEGHGVWEPVAVVEEMPLGAVRHFQTAAIVGFVRHTEQGFTALSGVCTHMSCFLMWNGGARTFDCPCHGGRFSENGQAAPSSPIAYSPLPAIQTKVEQGQVWVYVIPPTATTPATSATPTGDGAPTNTPNGYTR